MKLLNERVAVITGSTKGNGRAIANLYSEQGANVIVTGRSPSELKIDAGSVEWETDLTWYVHPQPTTLLLKPSLKIFMISLIIMKNDTSSKSHYSMPSPSSSSSLVQKIRDSNFHDHNMLIYPDLTTYRKVYSESAKQALDNNEVVFLVTTYDSFDRIKYSLTRAGISVDNEIKEGNLVILDSVKAYQIDIHGAVRFATTLAKRAERDGKKGVFGLTEMGSFFIAERKETLLEYEQSLPKKWELNNFKSACTYHKDDFATLSKQQQETILSAHNRVLA